MVVLKFIINIKTNIGIPKIINGTKRDVNAGPLNSNRDIIAIINFSC